MGAVRAGDLQRLTPVSRSYGFDRGTPVDRHYIEHFLARHGAQPGYAAGDICGDVLEVGGSEYARCFAASDGGSSSDTCVTRLDVLHVTADNPEATVVGDLTTGAGLPREAYDCIICTQTLPVVYEVAAAVGTIHHSLKPGGVVLATAPGISQTCRPDRDLWGDYWRFTSLSLRRLFEGYFSPERVAVEAYGNVSSAAAFLYGFAAEELGREALETRDPDYEVLIAVRAEKDPG